MAVFLEKYACLSSHNVMSNRSYNNLNLDRMTHTAIRVINKAR